MIKVSVDGLQTPLCERGVAKNEVAGALESMGSALSALEKLREAGEVGFLDLPGKLDDSARCIEAASRLRGISETLVVLGIGGSSLGGQALFDGCGVPRSERRVVFFDNVDPSTIAQGFAELEPAKVSVTVITKSGGTLETAAQFIYAYEWLKAALGEEGAKERIVFITDPTKEHFAPWVKGWGLKCSMFHRASVDGSAS